MLHSRPAFVEDLLMPTHALPMAPATWLHHVDRWLEAQSEARSPTDFAALRDSLRPHLQRIEAAVASDDAVELRRAIETLASQLGIEEILTLLRDPHGDNDLPNNDTYNDRGIFESGMAGGPTQSLRTVLGRLQQVLAPRQPPKHTSLAVRAPRNVPLLQPFTVDVQADPAELFADGTVVALPLPSDRGLDLEVELQVADEAALSLLCGSEAVLRVDRKGRSARVSFVLQASQPGHHRFVAIFRQHGMERRRILRAVQASAEPSTATTSAPIPTESLPCSIETTGPVNGLLLRVRKSDHRDPLDRAQRFRIEISGSALPGAPLCFERQLGSDIHDGSAEFCRRIDALTDLPSAMESELRVRALGEWLAKLLLSDEARALLDSPQIPDGTALHIESHDLWVPWELLLLSDRRSGRELFLGERFALSRWIDAGAASEAVGVGSVALVAPSDANLAPTRERKSLSQLAPTKLADLQSLADVQRLLNGTERCGILHFACHADNSADRVVPDLLILQDEVVLRPFDVPAARPDVSRAITGGLVFINACQTAIVAPSMARDRGWARAFIGGGAAALVACAWTVKNGIAARFAEEFYRQAQLGVTLAEAARQARCRIRTCGEHEPLGYALYAAPAARLTR